ncbi:hypothetical protein [Luteimonas sp. R10]|uniref:hypothetical protein n=1 Tax=Luteimonas sp. R10 TaxID=3108176 RepID=UPI00308EF315|nr:hypothetical protein U3649_09675 [Luteimonas sp. R10]
MHRLFGSGSGLVEAPTRKNTLTEGDKAKLTQELTMFLKAVETSKSMLEACTLDTSTG